MVAQNTHHVVCTLDRQGVTATAPLAEPGAKAGSFFLDARVDVYRLDERQRAVPCASVAAHEHSWTDWWRFWHPLSSATATSWLCRRRRIGCGVRTGCRCRSGHRAMQVPTFSCRQRCSCGGDCLARSRCGRGNHTECLCTHEDRATLCCSCNSGSTRLGLAAHDDVSSSSRAAHAGASCFGEVDETSFRGALKVASNESHRPP